MQTILTAAQDVPGRRCGGGFLDRAEIGARHGGVDRYVVVVGDEAKVVSALARAIPRPSPNTAVMNSSRAMAMPKTFAPIGARMVARMILYRPRESAMPVKPARAVAAFNVPRRRDGISADAVARVPVSFEI